MRKQTLTAVACVAIALGGVAGCTPHAADAGAGSQQKPSQKSNSNPGNVPSASRNEMNAQSLLRDAEAAESAGKLSEAMVIYEDLREFPEASRPKDLDRRIDALRKKMHEVGTDAAPSTGPATRPSTGPATP